MLFITVKPLAWWRGECWKEIGSKHNQTSHQPLKCNKILSCLMELFASLPNLGISDFAVRLLVPSIKNSMGASPSITSFWTYSLNTVQYSLSLPNERRMKKAQQSRSNRPISHMEWKSERNRTVCFKYLIQDIPSALQTLSWLKNSKGLWPKPVIWVGVIIIGKLELGNREQMLVNTPS